jgi:transposase
VQGDEPHRAVVKSSFAKNGSRGQLKTRLANLARCLIGMKACVDAHRLAASWRPFSHPARLMPTK